MSLVLDSSATLAWIYADETTDAISAVFERVARGGAVVPPLWRIEVANALTIAVRRRRVEDEFRRAALADLTLLELPWMHKATPSRGAKRCRLPIAMR